MTAQKEEKKRKNIFDRIGSVDYRIIYTIVAILIFIPLWSPLGIPMKVGQNVKDYADTINELPPGSVVLCYFSGYATMLPDIEPIYMATWKMLITRDVKFLVLLTHVDSPSVILMEMEKLNPEQYGKIYGRDYMFFPYFDIATNEAATIAFTEDIRSIFKTDFYGTPLDELPIMQNIRNAKDIDVVIATNPEFMVRRWVTPYGVTYLGWGTSTGLLPFVPPFYPTYCKGYVGGASQGGELEAYTGFYGDGIRYNDAKNLGIMSFLIFTIIGNIAYFGEKFTKGGAMKWH